MSAECPVALVTGGARRVGRAIVGALADAGYDVMIHYHTSADDAQETSARVVSAGQQAAVCCGDLADPAVGGRLVEATVARWGRLDLLVNNASIFEPDPDVGFSQSSWERTFQINTFAPAALAAAATEHLVRADRGQVINLCDIAAERPWRNYTAYCASKAALVNLTRALARRLAPRVRVNGVSPGIAVFPEDYDAVLRQKLIARVPLKRAGEPEDIASTVRFLATAADYITGQIINVDGGRSIA
jgi:pteridine reductase